MYSKTARAAFNVGLWLVAHFVSLALPAGAQTPDSLVGSLDTTNVRQLEAITVTADRPKAVAPPVTTIEVPAA